MAALLYAQDAQQRSLAQLHAQDANLSRVSIRTLERWSARDGWAVQREEFWTQVGTATAAQASNRLAEFAERHVADLVALYDASLHALRMGVTRPRSHEGLVRSVVELGKRIGELSVQDRPSQLPALPTPPPAAPLSDEDAHTLAMLMLRHGRARIEIVEVKDESAT